VVWFLGGSDTGSDDDGHRHHIIFARNESISTGYVDVCSPVEHIGTVTAFTVAAST
jgi:hypothetical protein